jgi:hypothetical protein
MPCSSRVPVMRSWTLLPLDPTDTRAWWTCAERSGNRSSRPSRGTTTPRTRPGYTGPPRSDDDRGQPRSVYRRPPRSGRPKRLGARAKMGSRRRAARSAPRPRCSGCPSPYSMCGAARLWAGWSTRCTVEVGSAAPGAVAGEHRSVAGWCAPSGGRAARVAGSVQRGAQIVPRASPARVEAEAAEENAVGIARRVRRRTTWCTTATGRSRQLLQRTGPSPLACLHFLSKR